MMKKIALFLSLLSLTSSLHSLEISFSSAKENSSAYSLIKLQDKEKFMCEAFQDDFETVTEIICVFAKRPGNEIKNVANEFFTLITEIKNHNYFIIIKPKFAMKLFAQDFDLRKDKFIFNAHFKKSKIWLIVGYKNEIPFLKEEKKSTDSINFPIYFSNNELPSVGGLDLKGNPIFMQSVEDVKEYIVIKESYLDKKYEKVISLIDEVIETYPNSIFMSEMIFYKIHALHELGNYENAIELSKHFLRQYSSDEHIGEVLLDIAHSYSKIGLFIDADYFFDRLFNEHKNSDSSYQGMIYKGEQYISSGDDTKAKKMIRKALFNTTNINIASRAAFELAQLDLDKSLFAKAELMLNKISNGNDQFFFKNYNESMKILRIFEEHSQYKYAANMAKYLLKYMTKENEEYERLLKDYGIFLANSEGDKKEAIDVLNRYLLEFKYGDYSDEVQRKKDSLFFEAEDENLSTKIEKYDKLIEEYAGDTIASHALYKKAKILFENAFYRDVLDMKSDLDALDEALFPDAKELVSNAAKELMKLALKDNKCLRVVELSDAYKIKLSSEWDGGIFECSMIAGNYMLAQETLLPYLNVEDINSRLLWQYRDATLLFKTGKYSETVKIAKDVIALIGIANSDAYNNIYRIVFDAYSHMSDSEGMINSIKSIEKIYGLDFKDLERYTKVLSLAVESKDNNMLITYANKIISLQESTNTYTQSPYVEFTLFEVYNDNKEYQKAIDTLQKLDVVTMKAEKRSRQQYLIASMYQKLGKESSAKEYYKKSVESDSNSAWAKLSQDALELIE